MSTHWDDRNAYKILVGKPRGRRPLGRSRHKCEERIKIGLGEKEWQDMHYVRLAQVRVEYQEMIFLIFLIPRKILHHV